MSAQAFFSSSDLAVDELEDVGVLGVEDDHLRGAAGLAARLDDAGEGVEALHEADTGPEAVPPPLSISFEERIGDRFEPVPEPYLKSMPSVFASPRIDSIVSSPS
jgi:hypothetical protein